MALKIEEEWNVDLDKLGGMFTVERYEDCTVEIVKNNITGSVSVGWYPNNMPPIKIMEVSGDDI